MSQLGHDMLTNCWLLSSRANVWRKTCLGGGTEDSSRLFQTVAPDTPNVRLPNVVLVHGATKVTTLEDRCGCCLTLLVKLCSRQQDTLAPIWPPGDLVLGSLAEWRPVQLVQDWFDVVFAFVCLWLFLYLDCVHLFDSFWVSRRNSIWSANRN